MINQILGNVYARVLIKGQEVIIINISLVNEWSFHNGSSDQANIYSVNKSFSKTDGYSPKSKYIVLLKCPALRTKL